MYIECKTKGEFKRAIASGQIPVLTEGNWHVGGSASVRVCGKASVKAWDLAVIEARGEAKVIAYGSVSVRAFDSAEIRAFDRVRVEAFNSASIRAFDSSEINAYDSVTTKSFSSAKVTAWDSAKVQASNTSRVTAYNHAEVEVQDSAEAKVYNFSTAKAHGWAKVESYDSSKVEAWGSATARACGRSVVEARGSAFVKALGSSTVRALSRAIVQVLSSGVTVEAFAWTTLILHFKAQVTSEPSVTVVSRIVQEWARAYGAKERDGKLVLYKWADENGETTNGFCYIEGQTAEAPDWNPDPDIECGFGLHACASLEDAKSFSYWGESGGLAVELLVDPKDCRPPQPGDKFPTKIRFQKAFVSRVWDPNKEGENQGRVQGIASH